LQIRLLAHGKVNLAFDVLGRRDDGYHEIRGLFQSIALADELLIQVKPGRGIVVSCSHPEVPTGPDNLVWPAAQLFLEAIGGDYQIQIHIEKRIPIAAGLGGGSADAAGVLWGLNYLFDEPLPASELAVLGLQLGADVPFCLQGGTAIGTGIGEKLAFLDVPAFYQVHLLTPPFHVSTGEIYQAFRLDAVEERPDFSILVEALQKKDLARLADQMINVLEGVTLGKYPGMGPLRAWMQGQTKATVMSGSGPSIIGLLPLEERGAPCPWPAFSWQGLPVGRGLTLIGEEK
jgi:4-diphosphocytidyl-2-C-methyl-D-erythritol kinase